MTEEDPVLGDQALFAEGRRGMAPGRMRAADSVWADFRGRAEALKGGRDEAGAYQLVSEPPREGNSAKPDGKE